MFGPRELKNLEKAKCRSIFNRADFDSKGYLDKNAAILALSEVKDVSSGTLERWYNEVDSAGAGIIDIEQFKLLYAREAGFGEETFSAVGSLELMSVFGRSPLPAGVFTSGEVILEGRKSAVVLEGQKSVVQPTTRLSQTPPQPPPRQVPLGTALPGGASLDTPLRPNPGQAQPLEQTSIPRAGTKVPATSSPITDGVGGSSQSRTRGVEPNPVGPRGPGSPGGPGGQGGSASEAAVAAMGPEDLAKARAVFNRIDHDRSGRLDHAEVPRNV